jgi:hypothetical protein
VHHNVVGQSAAGATRCAQPGAENGRGDDRAVVLQRGTRDVPLPRLQGPARLVRGTGAGRGPVVRIEFGARLAGWSASGQRVCGGLGADRRKRRGTGRWASRPCGSRARCADGAADGTRCPPERRRPCTSDRSTGFAGM